MSTIKNPISPGLRLALNMAYAVGNGAVGLFTHSWWFINAGAYYAVLTAARFSLMLMDRDKSPEKDVIAFAERVTGCLLIALSLCIAGINILSAVNERGTVYHEIVMITIALFTFIKIISAIVGMARAKHSAAPFTRTFKNISLADACVSVCSMQRSMLVTFPGMEAHYIRLFNILTGTAVWITVLFLGLNLAGGKITVMAKSKLSKANEKITEAVTGGYKKIEQSVTEGYKKIEQGVTEGYKKIEDKFIDTYLTKEGETVEEARERLKNKTE